MKKFVVALSAVAALGLAGCGTGYEMGTVTKAVTVKLGNGSDVECVEVIGGQGSVAIDCDFDR